MRTFFGVAPAMPPVLRLVMRFALVCAVFGFAFLSCTPTSHAQTRAQTRVQAQNDKHARKIHRRLEKLKSGSYLHLLLNDHTDNYGALGALDDGSFRFTNADTNAVSTISYSNVNKVRTDREPIGEAAAPEHHYFRTRTYVIAGVLIAGGAVAALEVR